MKNILTLWEQYKKQNWWESESIDVEKVLMDRFIKEYKHLPLDFEQWYELNEEDINTELAESGADRELDFNSEMEFDNRYIKYIETTSTINHLQRTLKHIVNVVESKLPSEDRFSMIRNEAKQTLMKYEKKDQ